MLCPYCNEELDKGLVQSATTIFWSQRKRKIIFSPNLLKGDIIISDNKYGSSSKESYLCKNCKKIIIDLVED